MECELKGLHLLAVEMVFCQGRQHSKVNCWILILSGKGFLTNLFVKIKYVLISLTCLFRRILFSRCW